MRTKSNGTHKVLAIDLGASGGRAVLGWLENDARTQKSKLATREILRFENKPVYGERAVFWDVERLFQNILEALRLAAPFGYDALGIDTWGVDYGLIKDGGLTAPPYTYRDRRTEGVLDEVARGVIAHDDYYKITGIAPSFINTVYQLYAEKRTTDLSDNTMLLMPDLFAYMLTGNAFSEYTIASTTGLLDHATRSWSFELTDRLGLPRALFPKIIGPGAAYGRIKDSLRALHGLPDVPVVAVATHDTASAIFAAQTESTGEMFISSGTWSLVGFLSDTAIFKNRAYTNEGGLSLNGGKVAYLKNIMGMWLQGEVRRVFAAERYSWRELDALTLSARDIRSLIDPNAPEFELPENMFDAIRAYCVKTGQEPPETVGECMRVINNSLAAAYADAARELTEIRGESFSGIRVVGGGSANKYLCERTAELTGLPVRTGPVEATALGNIAAQLIYLGESVTAESFDV